MINRITLLSSIILIIIFSCDNREDMFVSNSPEPKVSFLSGNIEYERNDEGEITDSAKVGKTIVFNYSVTNEVKYELVADFDSLKGIVTVDRALKTISYTPTTDGWNKIYIKVINEFGKENTTVLRILSFNNLPPVATATVNQVSNLDEYEIEVDATGSYDQDKEFGGTIIEYEFEVSGITKNVITEPKYNQILEKTGVYVVNVKVKDNDGEWSQVVSKSINVK